MNLVFLSVVASVMFSGCSFAEINIVQRSLMEEGQGISSSSIDSKVLEEESKMQLIVPIK